MSLSPSEILHVARLARLQLDGPDAAQLAQQLSGILDHFAAMSAIDTSGVAPMAHPIVHVARLRFDSVTESDQRALLQAGAPQVENGYFLVPRVIE